MPHIDKVKQRDAFTAWETQSKATLEARELLESERQKESTCIGAIVEASNGKREFAYGGVVLIARKSRAGLWTFERPGDDAETIE